MKPIRIDFAHPKVARFAPTRSALLILTLGVLGCCLASQDLGPLLDDRQALTERLEDAQRRVHTRTQAQHRSLAALTPEQTSAINRAVRRLNLPWRDLFDTLEQATPQSVALLTLQPDADRSILNLSAEAASVEDMIDYLQRLKQRPEIRSALLKKHQVDAKNPYHPVQFTLELTWEYPALAAPSVQNAPRKENP